MPTITADHHLAVNIEERRVHAVEHVLYHPIRHSIISVTSHSLQEIDPQYGATIGEAVFDLAFLSDKPTGGAATRLLEHVVPVGAHHVAAIFQSRCLVVWDLRDAVLLSVTEVEKQQKIVVALAASLCKDKWLFYASDGSNSIKVSAADAREPPKKISRKAANRSSQLTALAYDSSRRVLAAGASDGALQMWLFSEDNSLGGSTKEEAAIVTPLWTSQTTQSPVVRVAFAESGLHAQLLVVAYQNRVVEVWDLATTARVREPFRVAVLHCLPPQAMDFAKKNGEVSFSLDPQAPLLLIHWHAYSGAGASAAAVEIRLGVGSSAAASPVSVTDWYDFVPAAPPSHEDGSAVVLYGSTTAASLMAYVSTHDHRQLLPLSLTSHQLEAVAEESTKLSLSARIQLGVDQYFKYQDVPTTLLQISRTPEESPSSPGHTIPFQLQRYAQTSGEVERLEELPVWTNYQGRQLLPWTLLWSEQQSACCIQLRDPIKSVAKEDDPGVSYVLMEVKAKAEGQAMDDGDGGGRGDGASNVSVTCGSPMDALDVCFCDLRPEETKQNRPYVLLVLATTGKSIGFQMSCDQVDQNTRLLLTQAVRRIFPTPIPLSQASPYVSLVGSRLLYVVASAGDDADVSGSGSQTVVLSEDDLTVPRKASTSGFKTRSSGEKIVGVIWNAGSSQSTLSSADSSIKMLVAVQTTQRIVVLSVSPPSYSLSIVAEYDLVRDLHSPQSLLWMAQTLLFVTSDHHVRFVTPLVQTKSSISHLLCSLPSDVSGPHNTQLLSVCSDRLCYAVQNPNLLECKTYLRPVAVCEPLLLGFHAPTDGRLKAILERDFLVFLSTGGTETRNPVTERLLDVLYHDFGWTDTITKILDALLHPSSGIVSAVVASGAGGNATGSGNKKLTHLSPSLVSSLLFHEQKWNDAVRVHLMSDPALEEYALADDGLGSTSSAKLPSRTGATSSRFQWLGGVLASVGQAELALKCLDLAGDDVAIVELLRTHGLDPVAAESLLTALQKDWSQLNPPLAAISKATAVKGMPQSTGFQRHDLFSLLCCEQLAQTERRSRLLASVRPLDKLTMKTKPKHMDPKEKSPIITSGRASILYWKRLSPEDAKDVVGVSTTPHFSTDEPKNPTSYALFYGATSSGLSIGLGSGVGDDPTATINDDPTASSGTNDAAAKMTIGPFLDDEDAVVAYWRFEEGVTASDDSTTRTLDSMDTTKRENHLQILQFGAVMTLATSSAPVDKGEDGKLQEAFSLRFPTDESSAVGEWGAKCAVRPGSTLDIGLVFDDDPYRRKLTVEAWVRNVVLFQKKQATAQEGEDDGEATTAVWRDHATTRRRLVCRRGVDQSMWWEFGLCDGGFLYLTFAGHTLKADEPIPNAAAWQHVAFSVDITSPRHAILKLYLHARCVATQEISTVDSNTKLLVAATKTMATMVVGGLPPPPSTIHVGYQLTEYELTEVRVWATVRTPEQLNDMKENYLGMAEAKRRMKITIHQRNCQCEKCLGRRTFKPPSGKGGALLGAPLFPSTPPPAARDRRRPQPKA